MKSKILLAVALLLAISTTSVWAADSSEKTNQKTGSYTNEDVWAAYEGFNNTLLDPDKYIYKTTSAYEQAVDRGHGAAAIWCQPIYWDMSMNAYKLAKAQKDKKKRAYYKELCEKIFAGNKAQYCHFDFDNNNENTGWFIYDDIMWWTISLARAYELFGVDEYLKLSEESFSRVWYGSKKVGDTGSYDKENGGMFWQWQPIHNPKPNRPGDGKMACINFPTVVAALTLYNNVPKKRKESTEESPKYQTREQYLAKGKEIYEWGVENLLDKKTGRIVVMATVILPGKRMYIIKLPLSVLPYCFTKRLKKNATWIMQSLQQTIQSMKCLRSITCCPLKEESSKVSIRLFLQNT